MTLADFVKSNKGRVGINNFFYSWLRKHKQFPSDYPASLTPEQWEQKFIQFKGE